MHMRTFDMDTQIQKTEEKLAKARRLYVEWGANDKMYGGDRLSKAINRHTKMLEFLKLGVKCEDSGGQITIADKFHYILTTGNWRVKGTAVWNRSVNPKQFLNKIQAMTPMVIMPFKSKLRPIVIDNNEDF